MYHSAFLKQRMNAGRCAFGSWSTMGSSIAVEILAYAGFDFLILDHEHGIGDMMTLTHQLQTLSGSNTGALVRVPGHDSFYIRRVLDLGAEGVVVPGVNSAEEARAVVSACHYPRSGSRGAAPSAIRATRFGHGAKQYLSSAAQDTLVICQIESEEGVRNAAEIAAVDGVDMLFVGPYDLSASMGFMGDMAHPEVRAAIERIERIAADAGKLLGSVLQAGTTLDGLFERGYRLICSGGDATRLKRACQEDLTQYKDVLDKYCRVDNAKI